MGRSRRISSIEARVVAVLGAALLLPLGSHAETPAGPLAPRDECSAVPGLAELVAHLERALAARDADALLALADDGILLDFGGGSGKAELRRRLNAPDYRLWDEIDRALALGCGLSKPVDGDGGETYASWPWYFVADRDPPFDAFEAHIVTGEGVRLRSGPSLDAPVIGSVSWDYVRLVEPYTEESATRPYARVETLGGQAGYIARAYLRSLVDYRLVASRVEGEWRLTAFVAGD
ncbi:SH3 domain-containing protein [Erythrobacter sp.]|uniref:SH3 domain-containing protein n=1 Tax=Erythrobacter sp. TaxID=1042 RepID=UPI001425D6B9|nr:SH3 domain-containing protein [Erythrobacter sp.]QIQ86761.1 MAG: hypothetical protein G9473_08730 [Erythrobacter sp.]